MKIAHALAATLAVLLLLPVLPWHAAPLKKALAHDAPASAVLAEPVAGGSPVIAALRANGAEVTDLGERGGLTGHFVELAEGDAYGLYVTPDGHAVAGLLYGPDGSLLTGRQIAAARGIGGASAEIPAAQPAWRTARDREVSGAGRRHGVEEPAGAAFEFAHAHAEGSGLSDTGVPDRGDTLLRHTASAFGFTLGRAGPLAIAFADPHCRWSRSAVARLARLALDDRLRLHVVPVGVLGAASAREAAAIASAADPALAWFEGAGGRASPEGGRRIARNNALFDAWGAGAVPLIAWRARDGRVIRQVGDLHDVGAWLEALPHE